MLHQIQELTGNTLLLKVRGTPSPTKKKPLKRIKISSYRQEDMKMNSSK